MASSHTDLMKAFYLIGWPAHYSLSPLIHNGWFQDCDLPNHTYIIKAIDPKDDFVEKCDAIFADPTFSGANVTVPYKQQAYLYIKERGTLSLEACEEGVVNTITAARENAPLHGHTTDGIGFLKAKDWQSQNVPSKEKSQDSQRRGIVLGAGGVARSIVHALKQKTIPFSVLNRTPSRAHEMLEACNIVAPIASLVDCEHVVRGASFLINASSWGSQTPSQQEIIHISHILAMLAPDAWVMDLLYAPHPTPLSILAEQRGLSWEDGCLMLVSQAWYAFREWTGLSPSIPKALERIRANREGILG